MVICTCDKTGDLLPVSCTILKSYSLMCCNSLLQFAQANHGYWRIETESTAGKISHAQTLAITLANSLYIKLHESMSWFAVNVSRDSVG